ncbi:hypothetical protein DITRI_Ditri14bG0008800 [Diplodiscus trichospermus]
MLPASEIEYLENGNFEEKPKPIKIKRKVLLGAHAFSKWTKGWSSTSLVDRNQIICSRTRALKRVLTALLTPQTVYYSLIDGRISHLHSLPRSLNHLKLWSSLIQSTSTSLAGVRRFSLLQAEKAQLPGFSGPSPISYITSYSSLETLGTDAMAK